MARNSVVVCGVVAWSLGLAGIAMAQVPAYTYAGQYSLPAGVGTGWSVGNDGRVWGVVGTDIVHQHDLNGSVYDTVGHVPAGTAASYGAAFVRMNEAGTMLAIGDNFFVGTPRVHFVEMSTLDAGSTSPTVSVATGNYDGAWDGSQFYVTGSGSDFVPYVNRISFSDVAGLPVSSRVIDNVGGASGGIAFLNGRLYTGVGYTDGVLPTGQIRSFLAGGLVSGSPVEFTSGDMVTTSLSASPLGFDPFGNLLVGGGGDEFGFAAVINPLNPSEQLHLSPAGSFGWYSITFNNVTNQLVVSADGTAYVYNVPGPGAGAVMALGVLAMGRRRRA